jgi:HSP20 family protein
MLLVRAELRDQRGSNDYNDDGWPAAEKKPGPDTAGSRHRRKKEEAEMAVLRFEPFRDPLDRLMSLATTGTRAPLGMPLDIYRTEDGNFHVDTDLPGVTPDSIDVTVEHNTLTIKAERAPRYGEKDQVVAAERPQGSFTRQLALGEGADSEHLTADYTDGVLHMTIPAVPRAQARKIKVSHTVSGGGRPVTTGTPTP